MAGPIQASLYAEWRADESSKKAFMILTESSLKAGVFPFETEMKKEDSHLGYERFY